MSRGALFHRLTVLFLLVRSHPTVRTPIDHVAAQPPSSPTSGVTRGTRLTLRVFCAIVAVLTACLLTTSPSDAVAQQRDANGAAPSDSPQTSSNSDDSEDPSTPDGTSRHGVQTFDDVQVERIRPGELPPRSDTSIPDVLRPAQKGSSAREALPSPPEAETLQQTGSDVAARTWAVVAVDKPAGSLQETPSLFRGHAVAVGADPPILVTSYAWLKDVDAVYMLSRDPSRQQTTADDSDPDRSSRPTARRYDFDEATLAGQSSEWLDAHRDRLIQVDLFKPDKHRNLATLVPRDVSALNLPAEGLELFQIESASPSRLYGHTPYASKESLQMATLAENTPQSKALSYYLQTTWRPAHGAPLVTTDGKLVTLTAMQHPGDPAEPMTLVIPPTPLRSYLKQVRQSVADD
jgi:hypothetical protein